MGVRDWFTTLVRVINGEYERRIRSASEVTEYGAGHGHDHDHADHADHPPAELEEEAEVAEILNVPRGTRIGRTPHAADQKPAE